MFRHIYYFTEKLNKKMTFVKCSKLEKIQWKDEVLLKLRFNRILFKKMN